MIYSFYAIINKAGKNAYKALNKVSDAAGRVAGGFPGKAVTQSTHPHPNYLTATIKAERESSLSSVIVPHIHSRGLRNGVERRSKGCI